MIENSCTSPLLETTICQGSVVVVPYNVSGDYGVGNVFIAQLSDVMGSFVNPLAIGYQPGTAYGVVSARIPRGIATGNSYRVRVVSSDPTTTGSDNGEDITIHSLPLVSLAPFATVLVTDVPFNLCDGTPVGGSYSGPGIVNGVFSPAHSRLGTHRIVYSFTTQEGCSDSASQYIVIAATTGLFVESVIPERLTVEQYPNPFVNETTISIGLPSASHVSLSVFDLAGRLVYQGIDADLQAGVHSYIFRAGTLPDGTYVISVKAGKRVELRPMILLRNK